MTAAEINASINALSDEQRESLFDAALSAIASIKTHIAISETPYDISAIAQASLSTDSYSFDVNVLADFTSLSTDTLRQEEDSSYTPVAPEIGDPQIAITTVSSVVDLVSSSAKLFDDAKMREMAIRVVEGFAQGVQRPPSVDLSAALDTLNQILQAIQFGGIENP